MGLGLGVVVVGGLTWFRFPKKIFYFVGENIGLVYLVDSIAGNKKILFIAYSFHLDYISVCVYDLAQFARALGVKACLYPGA